MALTINPNFAETLKTTAASKAAMKAAQYASPAVIEAAQRIFQAADLVDSIFGEQFVDKPNPLMGYMTPKQVMEIMRKIREAQPTRKNLFYLRITDPNPPALKHLSKASSAMVPYGLIDLLALDVSYGAKTITGDKVQVGSGSMDKVTGTDAVEVQITTMDDENGTIKRWFLAKCDTVANGDGTFGLPKDYCVDIEVVHGIASPIVSDSFTEHAFRSVYQVRPVSVQFEMSRRDQALQEIQMTFTQFDTWSQPARSA